MDRMRNQIADAFEHGPVSRETRQTAEVLGHDRERKVPAARLGSCVSGMQGTVILNVEYRRAKRR